MSDYLSEEVVLEILHRLPVKSLIRFRSHGLVGYRSALGFDPRTNDYKVVRIVSRCGTKRTEEAKIPVVEIYSLNEGSWRITRAGKSFPPGFSFVDRESSTSLNGAVHFVVKDRDNKSCPLVLSFDLGDEVFRIIPVPNGAFGTSDYVRTSVIGGSLSLLCHDTYRHRVNNCCSIWVMKEYGVVDSWTKQFTVNFNGGLLLGLQKNGNMLVETKLLLHWMVSSYDPKSKQVKNLGICGMPLSFRVNNYMENLVLLDKPNDTVSKGERAGRGNTGKSCTRTNGLLQHSSHIWNLVPLCLMWYIWRERNQRTFEDLDRFGDQVLTLFSGSLFDWARAWGLTYSDSPLFFLTSLLLCS
nr:F-box protein At3g07870-like isoform X2 [Quercus suber]